MEMEAMEAMEVQGITAEMVATAGMQGQVTILMVEMVGTVGILVQTVLQVEMEVTEGKGGKGKTHQEEKEVVVGTVVDHLFNCIGLGFTAFFANTNSRRIKY